MAAEEEASAPQYYPLGAEAFDPPLPAVGHRSSGSQSKYPRNSRPRWNRRKFEPCYFSWLLTSLSQQAYRPKPSSPPSTPPPPDCCSPSCPRPPTPPAAPPHPAARHCRPSPPASPRRPQPSP